MVASRSQVSPITEIGYKQAQGRHDGPVVLDSNQRRQYECMFIPVHIQTDGHRGTYRYVCSMARAHTGIPQAAP